MDIRNTLGLDLQQFDSLIKRVPDFPKPPIVFLDITPLLENAAAFQTLVVSMAELVPSSCTHLLGIESRGFIFASALAHHLKLGLVLARKPGKLPRVVIKETYDLEYGTDEIQIHEDALSDPDHVMIIDDVLATGGTARATENLVQKTGATMLGSLFVLELEGLKGRKRLAKPATSIFQVVN